ncbi:MAG: ISLre2 family transposase [Clostridia bacterium]|jgi:hypothetical protein|nr:ISLre2 family transposase [Clostridia bacterium]
MNAELKIREVIEKSVSEIIQNIQKGLGKQSFSQIVEKTTEIVHQLGTALIEELITEMDELYNKERNRKVIQMRNHKSRKMITQIGEINLQRRLYFDKQRKQYFFAVDELLDIEKHSRIEKGLKRQLIANATLTSYGKASELSGHKVSRQTVHNIVKKLPTENVKVCSKGYKSIDKIYIEADEDHIHLNTGKSAEVKLVYVHEGTRDVCKGRTELINSKYFVSTKSSDDIWEQVFDYVYNQYQVSNAEIHISGDGASWIKEGLNYFPKAKYHLDKFHVYKSITDVSGPDKAMRRSVIHSIASKDFNTIRSLYSARGQSINSVQGRKSVANGLFYLENNFDEIDLTKRYSCAAEGHVSHVLSARLSSRPMGWSILGAEKIAKLRAYYFSDGKFSDIALEKRTQNDSYPKGRKYVHIAKKFSDNYGGIPTAHVVGIDGITNGLSVLLRSVIRSR